MCASAKANSSLVVVRQGSMRRYGCLRFVIGLCVLLAVPLYLCTDVARQNGFISPPQIARYLCPGHVLPTDAACDFGDSSKREMLYCSAFQDDGGPVYLIYDRIAGTIHSTSMLVERLNAGEVILAWGEPHTYRVSCGMVEIFWEERSAVLAEELAPSSSVRIIRSYLDEAHMPQGRVPWRGFVTTHRHDNILKVGW